MAQESNPTEFLLYATDDGGSRIDVRLLDETVWLTQAQMAELFDKSKPTINEHVRHIFDEKELDEASVIRKFRITASDGKAYSVLHYNLDVIISVGYRVRSQRGTQFRQWATRTLREFLIKGFALDDHRLAERRTTDNHFDELIERVRAIRTSEVNFWHKITDIYATSEDYDKDSSLCPHHHDHHISLPIARRTFVSFDSELQVGCFAPGQKKSLSLSTMKTKKRMAGTGRSRTFLMPFDITTVLKTAEATGPHRLPFCVSARPSPRPFADAYPG